MTLESIVTGLRTVDENPRVNPDYNPKTLGSTSEYIADIEKINLKTQEGLNNYKRLIGLPTKNMSPDKTALTHRQIHADITEGFEKYITEHIEPITDELSELKKSNIGYHFCPEANSENEKYNMARDTVHMTKEIIKVIEENPEAYVNLQISRAPDFMKGIIARFPEETCRIDMQDAQRKAFETIGQYGSTKFVIDTHKHLEALKNTYIADAKALNEKEKEIKENAPPYLDAEESVEYFAEIETVRAELEKRAEQLKILPQLTGTIVQEAIKTIQEREKGKGDYKENQND